MSAYLTLLFLLSCSFFFSGTETAVTAVSAPLLHDQEKQGNKRARQLNRIKANGDKLLSTLLFGNNVVNIAATAVSTSLMIDIFGERWGVIMATFVVSVVILIFSEILPKTYALSTPYSFAMRVTPLLTLCVKVFAPFTWALNTIARGLIYLLPKAKQETDTEEQLKAEIRGAIDMDDDNTLTQEKGMVKSVLDLDEVTVDDIMVHRSHLVSLNVAAKPREIFDFVSHTPFSRIPLWKGKRDNIVGILHVKAVLKMMNAFTAGYPNLRVLDYCTKPWFVLNTTSLLDQLLAFKKRREHFALVVDEYGDLQGVVTLEDVLEEIVGDISDENDTPEQSTLQFTKTNAGAWRIDGGVTIRDLNRHFKWELPDEEAATIAGLILYRAERIPTPGQTFVIDGYTLTVVGRDKNRLTTIDILPPAI